MKIRLIALALVPLLSLACSGSDPHYVVPGTSNPGTYTFPIKESTVQIELTSAGGHVYQVVPSATSTDSAPIFLTAIEDCGPQKTSLAGRLRQLFVGISLESLHVEETTTIGTTRASVGYSNGRFEEKNLVLSAVNLLPNDSCSVDVVFWSANPEQQLVRDRSFIVPVADKFLSLLRRS